MGWSTGTCGACRDGVVKRIHEYHLTLEGVTPEGWAEGAKISDQVEFGLCLDCIERARKEAIAGNDGYPLVVQAVRQGLAFDGEKGLSLSAPVVATFYFRTEVNEADRKPGATRCPHGEASPTVCKWCRGSGIDEIKPHPYGR